MAPGFICVAGVNQEANKHVRPVLMGRLSSALLVRNGGPFDIASEVDLGQVTYQGHPPEVEDHFFDSKTATRLGDITPYDYWHMLNHIASRRLIYIFGDALQQRGNSCTVDLGRGACSLGCLLPTDRPTLYVNGFDKIRLNMSDGQFSIDLSVTDLRLYEDDYKTPRYAVIQDAAGRIQQGVPVLVGIGLTKPWQKPGDTQSRHWLQTNNIHLADDPIWRLG